MLFIAADSTVLRMKNLVMMIRMILINLKDIKVLMTGLFPHLRTLAKLVPDERTEEKRNKP